MAEWKVHDDNWLVRQEKIADDRWLLCFTVNPAVKDTPLATGWVNVMKEEWSTSSIRVRDTTLEDYCLSSGGLLELECLAHEMRKKYGSE